MFESKLIRSRLGRDEKYHAIYLTDGTKIRIVRDGGMGAWIEVGPTPQITLDSQPADPIVCPKCREPEPVLCCEQCGHNFNRPE